MSLIEERWRSKLDTSHLQTALGLSPEDLEDDIDASIDAVAMSTEMKKLSMEESKAELETVLKNWRDVTEKKCALLQDLLVYL